MIKYQEQMNSGKLSKWLLFDEFWKKFAFRMKKKAWTWSSPVNGFCENWPCPFLLHGHQSNILSMKKQNWSRKDQYNNRSMFVLRKERGGGVTDLPVSGAKGLIIFTRAMLVIRSVMWSYFWLPNSQSSQVGIDHWLAKENYKVMEAFQFWEVTATLPENPISRGQVLSKMEMEEFILEVIGVSNDQMWGRVEMFGEGCETTLFAFFQISHPLWRYQIM